MKKESVLIILGVFLMFFMIGGVSAETKVYSLDNNFGGSCETTHLNNYRQHLNATLDKTLLYPGIKVGNEDIQIDIYTSQAMNLNKAGSIWGYFYMNNLEIEGYLTGAYSKNEYNEITFSGQLIGSNRNTNKDYFILINSVFKLNESQCNIELKEFEVEELSYNNEIIKWYGSRLLSLESNQTSQSQRLSTLESWKSAIDSWKTALTITINNIQTLLTGHATKIDNQETRISALESSGGGGGTSGNFTNYFKYLSATDRKNAVCGFAEDNHLNNLIDLGWNCTVTYRQTSRGETSSCKCKAIK